jgi:hypothetical protein
MANKLAYESAYKKANNELYSIIFFTVNASNDSNARTLVTADGISEARDGRAAWNALKNFHSDKSSQSKLTAVSAFLNAVQGPTESVLDYKNRVDKALETVNDLGVQFIDLAAVRFLTGLTHLNSAFVDSTIAANSNLTTQQHYQHGPTGRALNNSPRIQLMLI